MSATVSVVMPVRNGQDYVAEALDSLLAQTLADFELIVIDDGSTDRTPSILADYASKDARIVLLRTDGTGIVGALNLGLARAVGDYVARMDADDIALPARLAEQKAALDRQPHILVVGSAATRIDAAGRTVGTLSVPIAAADVEAALPKANPMLHPTVMMRRQAVEVVGGYRNALTHAEDYDLWLRLDHIGDLANLDAMLMKLRRHDGQISRAKRLDQRAASAMARLLDTMVRNGEAEPVDMSVDFHAALVRHLRYRLEDRRRILPSEAPDLAVMLRAASRANLLAPSETKTLCRRLVFQDGLRRNWALPFKLWLGR